MRIIDISRELLGSDRYPGDPAPVLERLCSIDDVTEYTVSALHFCLHTGTHADFPLHCVKDGNDASHDSLLPFIGECHVVSFTGAITAEDIERKVSTVCKRLLIHGNGGAFLTKGAAHSLLGRKILLAGTDSVSISSGEDELAVHRILLGNQIPVLEGLDLSQVFDGKYSLFAVPVKISGADAAPVRAVLLDSL